MKGYPTGYPDPNNRHQVATAERHADRRSGKPAGPHDVARIERARNARSGHAAAYARDWREADLKRRRGEPLSAAEQALIVNGDD